MSNSGDTILNSSAGKGLSTVAPELSMVSPELEVLNTAFARRYHSLAQYILDASPFVREEDHAVIASIRAIAQADHELAQTFAQLIEQLESVPYIPPYDHTFAEFNYLSIQFLADRLIKEFAKELAEYEPILPAIKDCSGAGPAMRDLCESLRRRIEALRAAAGYRDFSS